MEGAAQMAWQSTGRKPNQGIGTRRVRWWVALAAAACLATEPSLLAETIQVPGVLGTEEYLVERRPGWLPFSSRRAVLPGDIRCRRIGAEGQSGEAHLLTHRVVARVGPAVDVGSLAAEVGAVRVQSFQTELGVVALDAEDSGDGVLELQRRLRRRTDVQAVWVQLTSNRSARALPNDPYLVRQWTLNNTGQSRGTAGADARVFPAWEAGFTGKGVLVAVVDDGFELTHPDLGANLRSDLGWDYRSDDSNPSAEGLDGFGEDGRPRADAHGTAVSGIIAAVADNGFGVAGIAHGARVVPIRALQRSMTDLQEASALGHRSEIVSISNNSWGPDDDGKVIVSPGVLAETARETGVRDGRAGRGIVYVWAAGNGAEQEDDANYDGYANSIYAVAVGALTDRGTRCAYSEMGACLAVSAPSGYDAVRRPGTWTTDLIGNRGYNNSSVTDDISDNRFTSSFNGTSAAAPVVSAVVALMLEANPRLGWRDVKEILMRSAAKTDPTNPGWFTNGAGLHFNHEFGAGRVDAGSAVEMSRSWTNLPPQARVVRTRVTRDLLYLPDGDPAGIRHEFVFDEDFRVEQARLKVDITHPARGELQIELVSPSGTVSRLWSPHADSNDNLRHRFMSVFHWGEAAAGEWVVRLVDFVPDQAGFLSGLELELFGSRPDPGVRLSGSIGPNGTFELSLTGRPGARGRVQRAGQWGAWTDLGLAVMGVEPVVFEDPAAPGDGAWYRWVQEP